MQRSKRKYKQTILYFHHFAFVKDTNCTCVLYRKRPERHISSTANLVSEKFDLYFAIHKKSIVKC